MKRDFLRQALLAAALAASLAATVWVRGEEEGAVEAVPTAARPTQATERPAATGEASMPALAFERLGRRLPADTDADPFRAKSWYVPPPPPPPPPPPKPTAPPLPFQYVGKFEETGSGKAVIYLAKGNESFAVSAGDKFDNNTYQFEGIERGQMVLVYLPLAIKQRLPIGVSE